MKKTLLMAAATLAAGVISIQAQVYSQNIVGYVNQSFPAGFTAVGSPLNNSDGKNSATNVFPTIPDFSFVYVWNTNSFTYDVYESYQGSYYDGTGSFVVPTPNLPVGLGYFVQAATPFTNTYVGTLNLTLGASGATTTNKMNMVSGFNFVNPQLPIGGGLISNLQMGNIPDFSFVYTWNSVSQTYDVAESYQGSWYDSTGSFTIPEPTVKVGAAFFVQAASPFTWSMIFTNQ